MLSKDHFIPLIHEVDSVGYSPLLYAAKQNLKEYAEKLLAKGAKLRQQTISSATVLHVAAQAAAQETLALFVEKMGSDAEKWVAQKDIYNETALDIARRNNSAGSHTKLISYLEERYPDLPNNQASFAAIPQNIYQAMILAKMRHYLRLKYRDFSYFPDHGHCNGFTFLYIYYDSLGKREYFFRMMAKMAAWDGKEESLNEPVGETNDKGELIYKNLDEAFEQWINDVIWFQRSAVDEIDSLSATKGRREQLMTVSHQDKNTARHITLLYDSLVSDTMSTKQVDELVDSIAFMPPGTIVELSGCIDGQSIGHILTITVKEKGLACYDCNRAYMSKEILPVDQIKRLVNGISNYQKADYRYSIYRLDDHPKTALQKVSKLIDACNHYIVYLNSVINPNDPNDLKLVTRTLVNRLLKQLTGAKDLTAHEDNINNFQRVYRQEKNRIIIEQDTFLQCIPVLVIWLLGISVTLLVTGSGALAAAAGIPFFSLGVAAKKALSTVSPIEKIEADTFIETIENVYRIG